MTNNQHFDENIKEQFNNYAPDVHPRIWENIVAEKEKRKPAGFWFSFFNSRNILIVLGLLIAGGSGAYLFSRNSSEPTTTKDNTSVLVEKDKPVNNLQGSSPETNNNANDNKTAAATTAPILTTENNNISTTPVANTNNVSSPAYTKVNVYAPSSEPGNDGPAANSNKKRTTTAVTGPQTNSTNITTELISGTDNLPAGGSLLGRLMFEAQKITIEKNTKPELQQRKSPFWLLPDCPKLEDDAAGNKKYIEIYGGPDFAIRKLSDTGNSVYLQKRKESTKFSSAFSAGIRYTKVFSNSMSIRTGVNYSQINEKFTFVQGNLVQITYIIDVNGDTTGSYITTGTRYKTTHNKYRSVDVPLLVGYEIGNGKLHANINAGAVVNIYSWQKGEVLDTSLRPVSITTGKGSSPYQFKTNAGLGFMTSASVYYKLNDKMHVMAEPYFRYNFVPMNKDNLTLKQKYSTVGLRLGIRVDLK